MKHEITKWRHFALLRFAWITWPCPGKLLSSFFGKEFFLQFEKVETRTCHTVPSVLHSVTILLKLKLFRTGDSATSKENSVKLKGKLWILMTVRGDVTNFRGCTPCSSPLQVTYTIRMFLNRVLGDGAKFSPEMIDPGLAVVSKASVQFSTGCVESPSNTLELLGPA